jgi:twinkle protein
MKPMPVKGLLDLAEVREVDLSKTGRITTGITALDNATGGMLDGDLSVWTGKRGEGKSAFLNQIAIEAVEQDRNVCIYSGEVPVDRLKYQINLCAAGKENILKKPDTLTERTLCYLDHKNLTALDGWYGRRIWLYDNRIIELDERDSVIEKFTQAFRRYDCRVFIVDNLMTISIGAKANEVLQTQADFINRLRKFAEKYNVHVHCVVHPRKTKMVSDSDEVGGMGSITNIACNVFNIRKLDETSGGYLGTGIDGRPKIVQYNSELKILKNRAYGDTGDIALVYDKEARRFTQHGNMPKKYAWIKGMERWEYVDEIPDM